ncbi:MAG: hypothetical protein Q9216_000003 [Gyalolechia sp. 2 TL-2023]
MVLSGRLCAFASRLGVFEASCEVRVEPEEDRENIDKASLGTVAFCLCSCSDGEGEGDLEPDIHDLRVSLDKDRDIDLGLTFVVEGRGGFTSRISNTSTVAPSSGPGGGFNTAASECEPDATLSEKVRGTCLLSGAELNRDTPVSWVELAERVTTATFMLEVLSVRSWYCAAVTVAVIFRKSGWFHAHNAQGEKINGSEKEVLKDAPSLSTYHSRK